MNNVFSTIFFIAAYEKDGSQYLVEDFELKSIKLDFLQKIFDIDPMDPDEYVRDMVYGHEITEKEAKLLQSYVNFEFDFSKFDYMLEGRGDYTLSDIE